ncbi:MAG: glycoside hydrolase family 20 zincin-like fold domain-containing protein [Acidobacteriaceae bacterium]
MFATIFGCLCSAAHPQAVSVLFARGYTVLPEPQKVVVESNDFPFDRNWRLQLNKSVSSNDVAVETLRHDLAARSNITLAASSSARGVVSLSIAPGSVRIGDAQDSDKGALEEQAYRITLKPGAIAIAANAPAGLFYGVETLIQLAKPDRGRVWFPQGEIVDWPDVRLREIFLDELRHLDRLHVLKQAVRRAVFFKVNAIALRLNEHFQYASAPELVDPNALSPAQLQELTDYGLHYHVKIIPYLDGPAHVAFILERQTYKHLREFPELAFEMCSTNPETYKLLEGMYRDLMNANKGVQYFHLSTDEAWFVGKADNDQCHEAEMAKSLGSASKVWVEYTKKTAAYLQDHGRNVIFWGEDPLQPEDIHLLQQGLINGEVYSSTYNKAFRTRGIPQMIYTNSQPDDPLFPTAASLSRQEEVHPQAAEDRTAQVFNEISFTSARKEAEIMGAGIYAWGDLGLHPETFWLGYAVGAAAAWHPRSPDPRELTESFYRLYYGQGAMQMGRLYQLMSAQAQFFATSWDSEPSTELPLIFGYSYGIGPFVPHIETLPLPPVPTTDYLRLSGKWATENSRRVGLAENFLGQNDELLNLLYANIPAVQFNRYNLEVYLSIAQLCRQNLLMLKELDEIDRELETAQDEASKLHYSEAVASLDAAIDIAEKIRDERNQALQETTTTWYETWFPRVREGNGRHVAHEPQRFVDTTTSTDARRRQEGLLYLIDREFLLPFGDWVNQIQAVRNQYATAHKLPRRDVHFDWQDTKTLHSQAVNREL